MYLTKPSFQNISMEQSPSLAISTFLPSQGILQILLNSRVHRVWTRSLSWNKPNESIPHPPILLFKIRFNIFCPSRSSPWWSYSFPNETFCSLVFSSCMPRPVHLPSFDYANNIWRGGQILPLFVIQFSAASRYFLHFTARHYTQKCP